MLNLEAGIFQFEVALDAVHHVLLIEPSLRSRMIAPRWASISSRNMRW
ncbi:MAG: hypothetical protein H0V49_11710 [Nocardioidaceae bacterium]|nr:hypothetical protein [Nocardioidaceae bacterium]